MKILEVEQGSQEWLSWRKTVITATDCPAIMGSSPWATAYKIWQRKVGLADEQISNDAMQRGKDLEPEARTHFIARHGVNMTPIVVESSEFDFLGASLDGLSDCGKYLLEIKCGGAKLHDMAATGTVPEYYRDQIQHQLFVTGAEMAFYYSYNGSDGICIEVFPDADFKEKFMPKAREFWKCVALNEPPALQDADYKDMSSHPNWGIIAARYKVRKDQIKILEEQNEIDRKELINICGDQSCLGDGIKVMKTVVRGRVDYDAIPELKGVELDRYRKSSTTTWKILVS